MSELGFDSAFEETADSVAAATAAGAGWCNVCAESTRSVLEVDARCSLREGSERDVYEDAFVSPPGRFP